MRVYMYMAIEILIDKGRRTIGMDEEKINK